MRASSRHAAAASMTCDVKAAQQYAALLDANPRHPAANHPLGVLLAHAGRPRRALP